MPNAQHRPRGGGRRYIGQPVTPREYDERLRGKTRFVADYVTDDCLHAAFYRSYSPAARIVSVDVSAAKELDGVVCAYSGAELAEMGLGPRTDRGRANPRFAEAYGWTPLTITLPPVATDRARYVGDPVAVVVATDRYIAEDALELIVVDYEDAEPAIDPFAALRSGSHIVHAGVDSNRATKLELTYGEPPDLGPGYIEIVRDYRLGRQTALPMEGRGAVAFPDGDRMTVWSSTQFPRGVLMGICECTGWDPESLTVRASAVGGAFGQKTTAYGEEIAAAFVAKAIGRPVAWIEDRYENLVAATQGRDQYHHTKMTLDPDGRVVGWEDDFVVDFGAYCWPREGVVGNTMSHLLGPYKIPYLRITGTAVYTNKAPSAQYRGAGRPEAVFPLELSLNAAARELDIDPGKIRDRNMIAPGEMPYRRPLPYRDGLDMTFDGKDYPAVLDAALGLIPESEIAMLKSTCPPEHRIGVGVAAYMEATGRGPDGDSVRAAVDDRGRLLIRTGGGPSGQGHETFLAQIAADAGQRDLEDVLVTTGDPRDLSMSTPTAASRTAVLTGSAVLRAVGNLVEAIKATAVGDITGDPGAEVIHSTAGFEVPATGRTVSWPEIGQWVRRHGGAGTALDVLGEFKPPASAWIMSVHVAVVDVAIRTGEVKVLRYGLAHEGGPAINPRLMDGQLIGAVAQGISGALLEEITYSDDGQPTSTTLMDYRIAGVSEVPDIRMVHLEHPALSNELGVKGVGESGIIPCGAVLAGAVENALEEFSVRVSRIPISRADIVGQILAARRLEVRR